MSGSFDRISVRLPTKLKQQIADAARAERRTLSAYIVMLLEKRLEGKDEG